ncbi:hypothetical protein [Methylobacterium oxalidis]|uniref:Uncharacterized protein n=1 Tax=Methylobacterium oxalidis TaxID=944322 RepID=A0A512J7R5_9HYPH|nr:hypothetical protein [Methylobacterium oxalidis]GEP05970.1 hypothetical protein MOX02_40080 [Methylobacterium oxalidis]GJE33910.1 hypothetical protein LDDCCGHA_4114 [Methylobacterium oxalidis]GLS66963.1 hypothetical protein GCM10007888_53460 [Methylobacterium oxalidis]
MGLEGARPSGEEHGCGPEPGRTAEAWTFAEGLCAEHGLEPDFKDVATTSPGFVEKAARSGIVLP